MYRHIIPKYKSGYYLKNDDIILKFNPKNKEFFNFNEALSIIVDTKNINELDIRVFELNSVTYYKQTENPFDTAMNL